MNLFSKAVQSAHNYPAITNLAHAMVPNSQAAAESTLGEVQQIADSVASTRSKLIARKASTKKFHSSDQTSSSIGESSTSESEAYFRRRLEDSAENQEGEEDSLQVQNRPKPTERVDDGEMKMLMRFQSLGGR